jgi:phosphatidylinositol kinase/protein kinase (PI-3  family)
MEHDDIYEWVAKNREHFDMAESIRPDMKDETNNKVLGKFKDEMKSLVMTEFHVLRMPRSIASIIRRWTSSTRLR